MKKETYDLLIDLIESRMYQVDGLKALMEQNHLEEGVEAYDMELQHLANARGDLADTYFGIVPSEPYTEDDYDPGEVWDGPNP